MYSSLGGKRKPTCRFADVKFEYALTSGLVAYSQHWQQILYRMIG